MHWIIRMAIVMAMAAAFAPVRIAATQPSEFLLRTLPTQVYFTQSNAKERIDGTVLFLILEQSSASAAAAHKSLELVFRKDTTVVHTERLLPTELDAIDVTDIPPTRLHSDAQARTIRWPHAYRLVLSVPSGAGADSLEVRLNFESGETNATSSTVIPIRSYEQKTKLIFPFRGNGIISAGGALASGHRNRSGLYATDALGLTENYGPMRAASADLPSDYAGWGREIIAPAAGKIVIARNDRPDQPKAGNADPAYFLPQYPDGGDPGNHVVIDHGNGEFSMIAHLQKGSVRVKPGDLVTQGQVLGLMGNSGDTSGPHVHYQLQSGPDWERSDALPFAFTNVQNLTRGSYFEAR